MSHDDAMGKLERFDSAEEVTTLGFLIGLLVGSCE